MTGYPCKDPDLQVWPMYGKHSLVLLGEDSNYWAIRRISGIARGEIPRAMIPVSRLSCIMTIMLTQHLIRHMLQYAERTDKYLRITKQLGRN